MTEHPVTIPRGMHLAFEYSRRDLEAYRTELYHTRHLLHDVVSESQCAFRRNRGTIDMIFAVRQIKEKCRKQNQNLYILFVHLTKAFNTVGCEGLLAILLKLGCPLRVLNIIRSFHDGMMTCIVVNGVVYAPSQTPIASRKAVYCLQFFLCSLPCCFLHSPPQILASLSATDMIADSLIWDVWRQGPRVLKPLSETFSLQKTVLLLPWMYQTCKNLPAACQQPPKPLVWP